ncbi:ETX/MTX2 family pore-forming toxin [Paenibacillus sp. FSL H8-0537]|uniref:ETX/MTX2 family pore-forming toxin n=1 Tax=Paenibacillus sp. FSL H8-0537 TaxID=2921399 RepID=UPI003100B7F9
MADVIEYQVIVSKARTSDNKLLVITAAESGEGITILPQVYGNEHQLWEKRKVRAGDDNAYALVNKATGKCIGRKDSTQGSKIYQALVTEADVNGLMVWRDDNVAGTHNAINSYVDWEQKLNIPGDGPFKSGDSLVTWEWCHGQINELWVFVPDRKKITVKKMEFQMDSKIVINSVPIVAAKQLVTNHSNVQQTQQVTLKFSKSQTYNFKWERGLKVSETLEFKAGLPLVGDTGVKISVEGSRSYSESKTQDESQEVSLQVPVVLPAGATIEVSAILLQGVIDVPYTVTFEVEYPTGKTTETASGKYTGVNTFTVNTEYKTIV